MKIVSHPSCRTSAILRYFCIYIFLVYQTGISAVFTHVRSFYLTPQKDKIRTAAGSSTTITLLDKSDVIGTLKWRHYVISIASQRIKELLGAFFKYKNAVFNGVQEKESHYLCEGGIEKSVPHDHHLSSLVKPHDDNRWSSGLIFLSNWILILCIFLFVCFSWCFMS